MRWPGSRGWPAHQRPRAPAPRRDRKSTRLNSSHSQISYAVFCLKKKTELQSDTREGPSSYAASVDPPRYAVMTSVYALDGVYAAYYAIDTQHKHAPAIPLAVGYW